MATSTGSVIPAEAAAVLDEWLGSGWSAAALTGDASVRAYYRVQTREGRSLMLAYYPENAREGLERYVRACLALGGHVPLPQLLHHGPAAAVQQDLGDLTLFDLLKTDRARAVDLYESAIDLMIALQTAPSEAAEINPPFDAQKFRDELEMTRVYYVDLLSSFPSTKELDVIFSSIANEMAAHPYVLCHRDFHGQNIHILNDSLYVIDFQDLRMGPDTYDLASLLRDRGVARILGEQELDLVGYYASRTGGGPDLFERYWVNLLQRSIKTIGTFARQAIERQRKHYLGYISPALESVERCIRELPRYEQLRHVFPMIMSEAGE